MNYERFLSAAAKRRQPSAIRALMAYSKLPNMISLGGGNPNPDLFPIADISFSLKSNERRETISLGRERTEEALQYSPSAGIPALVNWWKGWLGWWISHKTNDGKATLLKDRQVVVTCGSQDGLTKAFEMLLDPMDQIIVESPTYSGSLAALRSLNLEYLQVGTDGDGLVVEQLEKILAEKSTSAKVLYTIPNGSNPSGASTSGDRRKQVYKLAQKHDLLILEDDPYALLHYDYDNPIESYLSMDTDGRVIRFDSLSKVVSAGLRIGFVTLPNGLLADKLIFHQQSSILHASGVSQAIALSILSSSSSSSSSSSNERESDEVQFARFFDHARKVAGYYRGKKEGFQKLALKYLAPLGVTWYEPTAGMFYWLNVSQSPAALAMAAQNGGVFDSKTLVKEKGIEAGILLVPGAEFTPSSSSTANHYVRASFSTASESDLETALIRLAKILR